MESEERRTEMIDLLLTDCERANIELAAAFQQKTVNAFVVEALLDAAKAILKEAGSVHDSPFRADRRGDTLH